MIICIVGPTGVGKTKLSIELAKALNGEIINADSTQIFKELDIATAKVKEEEKEEIIHHLIDVKNIDEDYTVYDYQKDARKCIESIVKNKKTPIFVGGTGLYLKAALYDYKFNEEIKYDLSSYSDDELYNKLLEFEKDTLIHKNNRRRVERKVNFYLNNLENTYSKDKLLYDNVMFIGLTCDRNILYDRINKRVDEMIENGLIEEASKIYKKGVFTKAVMTPIGYKELFKYFKGESSLEEAIDEIKTRSRRYAKRQYTWFNNQMNVTWFEANFANFDETVKEVLKYIESR